LDNNGDSDDAPRGRRNKGMQDGRRKEKLELKSRVEQERLKNKINEMMTPSKKMATVKLGRQKRVSR
jgi:hypothetical protein